MTRCTLTIVICALLLTAEAGPSIAQDTAAASPQLTDAEKLYGLSLFWKEVSDNFAYFDQVPDLDWDAAYREFIPQVLATHSTLEYYQVLRRFSALLNDGHTDIGMPRSLRGFWDEPGIRVTEVNRRAIVTNVIEELEDQAPLGSEITAVDSVGVIDYVKANVIPYFSTSAEHVRWYEAISGNPYVGYGLLYGPPNSVVTVTLTTPDGGTKDLTLTRNTRLRRNETWLKPMEKRGPAAGLQEWRWLEDGLLYVRIYTFAQQKLLDRFKEEVVPELPKARGIVIDLRYCPGGSSTIAAGILDYFIDKTVYSAATHTRIHDSYRYAIGKLILNNPELEERIFDVDPMASGEYKEEDDPEVYKKIASGRMWRDEEAGKYEPTDGPKFLIPVVVLTGYFTASAAEDFLVYIDGLDHFVTVGEPTYGSTGQPVMFGLPGGGVARVCTKRDTFPDGRIFVGYGIQPEVPVQRTVASVLGEKDVVLDKGVETLKKKITGEPASG